MVKKFEHRPIFTSFDTIHERDIPQTDRLTDGYRTTA